MSPPPKSALHPDFKDDADVCLVSSDGVQFNIASSHLTRTSAFFAGMFTLPQPPSTGNGPHVLSMLEDSPTLEILLKLALGLPAPFSRLNSLSAIDIVVQAAAKYDMPGVSDILRQLVRGHLTTPSLSARPLHQFAIASCCGLDDIAEALIPRLVAMELDFKDMPPVNGQMLARLLAARQERVKKFIAGLKSTQTQAHTQVFGVTQFQTSDGGLFARENGGYCEMGCKRDDHAVQAWRAFADAFALAFAFVPSVGAVMDDPEIRKLFGALEGRRCERCKQMMYTWSSIYPRLLKLVD